MFNAPAISLVIYTYHICEPMPILSDQCVQVHMTGNDGTILQTEPHHCAGGCFSCVTTHNTDKISSSVYVSTCAASALFALPVTHCVSCKKATCFAIRQQSCLSRLSQCLFPYGVDATLLHIPAIRFAVGEELEPTSSGSGGRLRTQSYRTGNDTYAFCDMISELEIILWISTFSLYSSQTTTSAVKTSYCIL
eukprot:scpid71725/ scgid3715/ 